MNKYEYNYSYKYEYLYLFGWCWSRSYSINVNRLRLGVGCTVTVARNTEFLTLTLELDIGTLRLPHLGSERSFSSLYFFSIPAFLALWRMWPFPRSFCTSCKSQGVIRGPWSLSLPLSYCLILWYYRRLLKCELWSISDEILSKLQLPSEHA